MSSSPARRACRIRTMPVRSSTSRASTRRAAPPATEVLEEKAPRRPADRRPRRTTPQRGRLANVERRAAAAAQPPQPVLQHEGHLFKRGEQGFLSSDATKRRYFVLRGFQLYYFKTWEDFGAGGMKASINADHPIDLRQHEPVVVREEGGKPVHNRFDLVPTSDPLAPMQLQAASANELERLAHAAGRRRGRSSRASSRTRGERMSATQRGTCVYLPRAPPDTSHAHGS